MHEKRGPNLGKDHEPGTCMEILEIDIDPVIDNGMHKREAFWCQTISSRRVRAGIPFHAGEVDPVKICKGIQPRADDRST
jgi:hypothetical protein